MTTTPTSTIRSSALVATATALAVSLVSLHFATTRPVAAPAPPSTGDHHAIASSADQGMLHVVWRGRRRR
jgi:hypothetical protein